jgi:isopenicillin N synthase-like dioxygenase
VYRTNIWPERPVSYRQVISEPYRELDRLAANLLRIFALALDLPESGGSP